MSGEKQFRLFSNHLTATNLRHERDFGDNPTQKMSVYDNYSAKGRQDALLRPILLYAYRLGF